MVQFLALCFSPCILSLCMPLLTHTIIHHSFADDLQLQMSAPPDRISELLDSILEHIGLVVRLLILDTEVDGSNPSISMFFP